MLITHWPTSNKHEQAIYNTMQSNSQKRNSSSQKPQTLLLPIIDSQTTKCGSYHRSQNRHEKSLFTQLGLCKGAHEWMFWLELWIFHCFDLRAWVRWWIKKLSRPRTPTQVPRLIKAFAFRPGICGRPTVLDRPPSNSTLLSQDVDHGAILDRGITALTVFFRACADPRDAEQTRILEADAGAVGRSMCCYG